MNLAKIAIALPDSMVYESKHIRDKTEKLGYIARALAIFQVTDVYIYHSPFITPLDAEKEKRIIKNVLGYLECPQMFSISQKTFVSNSSRSRICRNFTSISYSTSHGG